MLLGPSGGWVNWGQRGGVTGRDLPACTTLAPPPHSGRPRPKYDLSLSDGLREVKSLAQGHTCLPCTASELLFWNFFSPSLSNWNDLSESQLFLCSSCLSLQPYLSAWHITLLCSEDTAFKKKINYRFVVTLCLLVPFSRQPLLALYLCVTFGNSCNIPRFSIVRLFVMVTDEWPLMWPLWLTEGSDDGYHF